MQIETFTEGDEQIVMMADHQVAMEELRNKTWSAAWNSGWEAGRRHRPLWQIAMDSFLQFGLWVFLKLTWIRGRALASSYTRQGAWLRYYDLKDRGTAQRT